MFKVFRKRLFPKTTLPIPELDGAQLVKSIRVKRGLNNFFGGAENLTC